MVEVDQVVKRFGRAEVLRGVSFATRSGEVLGLLGPNGAGKTTTLRMLAGYLAPTSGRVLVDGSDIARRPSQWRRRIGYLPENVPLYPEMRIGEYLDFRAALKGIARRLRPAAVSRAIDEVGLGERRAQIVGTLSRGYRQRVGLADALLGRPPILILDEPTVGLDPNQIRETRALIRALGRERTILLSTHVLPEVEAVATRVIILNRGQVVAAQTQAELRARLAGARRVIVELAAADLPRATQLLGAVSGVGAVDQLDETRLALTPAAGALEDDGPLREAVFRAAVAAGLVLRELRLEAASLEELFARATSANGERSA